jgi:hypothetical protein
MKVGEGGSELGQTLFVACQVRGYTRKWIPVNVAGGENRINIGEIT